MRLSHTRATTFKSCPQKDYYKYTLRVRPTERGASLDFGSSIDVALAYLLNSRLPNALYDGLAGFKGIFETDPKHGWQLAFDNPSIRYRRPDYDSLVLNDQDKTRIETWEKELNTTLVEALSNEKQSKYKRFDGNNLKMFNRLCWLSMLRKGHLMLDSFAKHILPRIKKVIAVQHEIVGEINKDTQVIGIVDLVCEFEGYPKPVVFDIKTSALPYDSDAPLFSEQLLLYLGALGKELKTSYVGFLVMVKAMERTGICSKCKTPKTTKHQTCPVEINGKRCEGAWIDTPKANTQVQVETISSEKVEAFLNSFANLADNINLGKPYMNLERCHDYGRCDYFDLCHYQNKSKYIFPEEKKLPVINNEEKI